MTAGKLWGGRFRERTAGLVEEYTESVSYDRALYAQDIAGSKAHARMLARQGVISAGDAGRITEGLEQIRKEIESGEFVWRTEMEDVHMPYRTGGRRRKTPAYRPQPQRSGGP
jgi:argininosuccinate lyase